MSELHPAKLAWLWSEGIDMPQRVLFCTAFRAAIADGCDITTAWNRVADVEFRSLRALGRKCGHGKCMEPAVGTWGGGTPICDRHMREMFPIRTRWR